QFTFILIIKKKYGLHRGDFPVTEYVSDRVFCLPLSAKLTEKDVEDVIKGVKLVLDFYRK
ncbi:MAG: DegT/DnrJ/EryC1/StrS family aminotransferase, partial [Patescibacteria group bacterium]|nr:DegT/DnrJ/EryC1/StrS family aminotransferase [Patescibacteria group bacterium]